jgi:hypothetical protein
MGVPPRDQRPLRYAELPTRHPSRRTLSQGAGGLAALHLHPPALASAQARTGDRPVEWVILIVLVVLLLAALGPRGGYYGTASPLWDVLSLIIGIALIVWLLDLLGVINVIG